MMPFYKATKTMNPLMSMTAFRDLSQPGNEFVPQRKFPPPLTSLGCAVIL